MDKIANTWTNNMHNKGFNWVWTNMLIGSTIDFKQIFLYQQFLDEVLSEWKELLIHRWIKLQTHGQISCTIRDLIDFEQIYRLA